MRISDWSSDVCSSDLLRGDFGAVDRRAVDAEVAADRRQVEAGEVEDLGDPGVGQQRLQIGRVVAALGELHEVADAVAGGELQQAQPVASEVETHGLAVDGNRPAEGEAPRQVASVQVNFRSGHAEDRKSTRLNSSH